MPKPVDLRIQQSVLELRGRGWGIRRIGRTLGIAASSVSRIVRKEVNRRTLQKVEQQLAAHDQTFALVEQCFRVVAELCIQLNRFNHSQQLKALLMKWPDGSLKREVYGGVS